MYSALHHSDLLLVYDAVVDLRVIESNSGDSIWLLIPARSFLIHVRSLLIHIRNPLFCIPLSTHDPF